jgi:pimeloyl-ACP methyl ester carboxylesterase
MSENMVPLERWMDTGPLRVHYLDWGNAGAAPMVLVHGMCASSHCWDFFADSMKRQFHILAPDQRGHGDSSWSREYHLGDYVSDLKNFVDILDLQNIVLIGHSLGGVISTVYAANNPEKVESLVIVDIGPELKEEGLERRNREWPLEPSFFNSVDEVFAHLSRVQPYHSEKYIRHLLLHDLKQDGEGRIMFKYDRKICEMEMHSPEWLWDYIKMIVCPTLVIHGVESDLLDGDIARWMAATLAFGSVVDIERAAHTVQGDNPEAFESAVRRFLGISG